MTLSEINTEKKNGFLSHSSKGVCINDVLSGPFYVFLKLFATGAYAGGLI